MTTALAERPTETLGKDQIDLIKKTVAAGATDDELRLFLHDCARRGVHPLDKLLHFTKRGGKYTPVTSIDFMRSQAAASGEMAGSDDATFDEPEVGVMRAASVTVYRLTQGTRYAYAATARWGEYYPGDGPQGTMWRKMPHTMLGKCAEALALRKAFPQQLAGLYAREEMDQAEQPQGYTVEAPARVVPTAAPSIPPVARTADDPNALYVERVTSKGTKNPNVTKFTVILSDGREVGTIRNQIAELAEQVCQDREPVEVETSHGKWGEDLLALRRVKKELPSIDIHDDLETEIDLKDLPF